ncbi:Dabb family protein [Pseudodesulfovibrio senegalensis]|jgi:hypothetical protein|uniref:Dabb family protein n=1 Tax=Pseudodesulfovibrio senegalensis TaxID=1721087 RepID=A0A6N6N5M2_9BACT|nr:Dabb family protein [Pseudodesulfovibrio senegalensis]KAB1443336.1 Dabb family protein [Pseudodesulfovibrio senegalensis]
MIKHIVMWKLKDNAEGAEASANAVKMKEMLEGLRGRIPGLVNIEVGIEMVESVPECDVVLYSEIETREALEAYQIHPEHQACVAFIKNVVSERRVVDYEI